MFTLTQVYTCLSFIEENWEKSWDRNDSKSLFFVVVVLEWNFKKRNKSIKDDATSPKIRLVCLLLFF